jgi:hypothetical protein
VRQAATVIFPADGNMPLFDSHSSSSSLAPLFRPSAARRQGGGHLQIPATADGQYMDLLALLNSGER